MWMILGIAAGIGLPIQTGINTKLRRKVGTPYHASLASFLVALLFLLLLLLVTGQEVALPLDTLRKAPLWIWCGGICGVIFLTGNIRLFAEIGSVQTVILPVLGQILMGLVVDGMGLFGAEQKGLTALRVAGALLVAAGVLLVSLAKDGKEDAVPLAMPAEIETTKGAPKKRLLAWRAFGVIAGMLSAVQIAVNGCLGKVIGSPLQAAAISFAVGSLLLGLLCIGRKERHQAESSSAQVERHPWWIWLGGIVGGLYILANATLSGSIGTGMTVMLLLIGATIGGLLVDRFGWFGSEKKPLNAAKLLGLIVMIVGAVAIKLF